jgi:hypothetical protein
MATEMHEIYVTVVSARIEPGRDGAAVVVGAHSLADAIAEANRLLSLY